MPTRSVTIGVDAHVLTGRFQGTRTTLTSLLKAVAPRLGARRLIAYSDNPDTVRGMLGDAFEHRALPRGNAILRLLRAFPNLFRQDRVDFGVFQYIAPLSGRNIVFIHDILPLTRPRYFSAKMRLRTWLFFSLSIRRAAMVLVVSEDTRRDVARRFGLPPERLRAVLNGPSFAEKAYRGEPAPAERRYIMTVGRIEPRKNVPLLIEAFLKADLPDVSLIVIGSFDYNFKYAPPDDPRVEIRHGIDDEALIELYRGASLFVYPSAAEGFGIPLLDATLFGLPIISSDRTALPEVGGDLADYFDPEAADAVEVLAAKIAGHFGDRPVPRPTPEQRRAQAERFSWDRAAEAFLAAVDSLARSEGALG